MSEKQGTVSWFNPVKGFGFLRPDGHGGGEKQDDFVHISAVEAAGLTTLNAGDRVRYQMVAQRNGKFAAANIKLINQ